MKKITFSFFTFFLTVFCFSQGANLDRNYFKVSYVNLPSNPILEDQQRTFSANFNYLLGGFTRVSNNGNIDAEYVFDGTEVGEVEIKSTKHESKDKEGNVTSTTYTYNVLTKYTSTASVSVGNAINNSDGFSRDYTESEDYKSKDFKSGSAARQYYNDNNYKLKNDKRNAHRKALLNRIKGDLSVKYGYTTNKPQSNFWILGKKKHPEYAKHKEFFEKSKSIFDKMKYDQPVDALKEEFAPIIAYFESVVTKYNGPKKKDKKMRYASFFNIAQIYYYLDEPEKAKEYGQKLIDNDYDKGDGKRIISKANGLSNLLDKNKMTSRHMEIVTENEADAIEEKEAAAPAPALNGEISKAYMINKKNDTLIVSIKKSNLDKVAYNLKTAVYDESGGIIGDKEIKASACKELLLLDGTHYKNINFKEASAKGEGSEKLCKVLHESDKVNLYLFNNKETVIYPKGAQSGTSTQGTSYAFGFNKNLLKLAEGCDAVKEKINAKEFKNTPESLTNFCVELSKCK